MVAGVRVYTGCLVSLAMWGRSGEHLKEVDPDLQVKTRRSIIFPPPLSIRAARDPSQQCKRAACIIEARCGHIR